MKPHEIEQQIRVIAEQCAADLNWGSQSPADTDRIVAAIKIALLTIPSTEGDRFHPDYDKAVRLLWEWQYQKATHFSAKLFELMGKSDPENLAKLARSFPYHVCAFTDWHRSGMEDFFSQRGYRV